MSLACSLIDCHYDDACLLPWSGRHPLVEAAAAWSRTRRRSGRPGRTRMEAAAERQALWDVGDEEGPERPAAAAVGRRPLSLPPLTFAALGCALAWCMARDITLAWCMHHVTDSHGPQSLPLCVCAWSSEKFTTYWIIRALCISSAHFMFVQSFDVFVSLWTCWYYYILRTNLLVSLLSF